jgi:amidase
MATTTAPPIADWQTLAQSKRESVFAAIPKDWLLPPSQTSQYTETSSISVLDVPRTCGILTEKELDITGNYDATDLVGMMSERRLTSTEVVTAFCKRAAVAQQCVSCLTEIMFEEAIARAKECDDFLNKEGKVMGPLHGLPISLKVLSSLISIRVEGRMVDVFSSFSTSTTLNPLPLLLHLSVISAGSETSPTIHTNPYLGLLQRPRRPSNPRLRLIHSTASISNQLSLGRRSP